MKITISAPLQVPISKNKHFILNMNAYRNTHYQSLNKAKVEYKDAVDFFIAFCPAFNGPVEVTYRMYPGSKRKMDTMNVCSIHSKFFLDALVSAGKIPDDTYEHVTREVVEFGAIDKSNPRVEITVEAKEMFQIKKSAVEVTLTQENLEKLVADALHKEDPTLVVDEITFKATRKPPGVETIIKALVGSTLKQAPATPRIKAEKQLELVEEEISEPYSAVVETGAKGEGDTTAETDSEISSEADTTEESFEEQESRLMEETLAEEDDVIETKDSVQESVESDAETAEEPKEAPAQKKQSLFAKRG